LLSKQAVCIACFLHVIPENAIPYPTNERHLLTFLNILQWHDSEWHCLHNLLHQNLAQEIFQMLLKFGKKPHLACSFARTVERSVLKVGYLVLRRWRAGGRGRGRGVTSIILVIRCNNERQNKKNKGIQLTKVHP
jgi:hypothetical protein